MHRQGSDRSKRDLILVCAQTHDATEKRGGAGRKSQDIPVPYMLRSPILAESREKKKLTGTAGAVAKKRVARVNRAGEHQDQGGR